MLIIPEILIASTVSVVLENIAVVTMWFGNWYSFYIVQKEVESDLDVEMDPKISSKANINVDIKPSELPSQILDENVNHVGKEHSVVNIINETDLKTLVKHT